MFTSKKEARKNSNEIDNLLKQIDSITQSEIDRLTDKIDSELNSCGRELTNSIKILAQVKPLMDRLVAQVGQNAPDHVQVLVTSIAQEVMSKIDGSIDNLNEVKQNIQDVDQITDQIDKKTDQIDELTDKIDKLTDKFQD
jgi:peptidoglycan hydrolase CwlO-like protein